MPNLRQNRRIFEPQPVPKLTPEQEKFLDDRLTAAAIALKNADTRILNEETVRSIIKQTASSLHSGHQTKR
jgi:hypothetical protein